MNFIPIGSIQATKSHTGHQLHILSDVSSDEAEDEGAKTMDWKLKLAKHLKDNKENSPLPSAKVLEQMSDNKEITTSPKECQEEEDGSSQRASTSGQASSSNNKKRKRRTQNEECTTPKPKSNPKKRSSKKKVAGKEETNDEETSGEEDHSATEVKKRRKSEGNEANTSKQEGRLRKLRKYVHHSGIFVNYKRLFDGATSAASQIQRLETLLEEKGLEKPFTLEKCKQWKIERENEQELQSLSSNLIIGDARGSRTTRSAIARNTEQKPQKRSKASIEEDEDEETLEGGRDDPAVDDRKKLFAGLANIVSSDDDDDNE